MEPLINPNLAYLLVVAAVMLVLLNSVTSFSTVWKVGTGLCLTAAALELIFLRVNPWAFLAVAISPLPFFVAARQTRLSLFPLFITLLLLFVGAFYLFMDQDGYPAVHYGLAGVVSALGASSLWILIGRKRNREGLRVGDDPESVVGRAGQARTNLESHAPGWVWLEGELWQARSEKPIPAGHMVRVLRQDGSVLTVKEMEKLTKK